MRKIGRPRATHCKRGHERVPGQVSCVLCRRFRERQKYKNNAEFMHRKRRYQSRWRKSFFAKNGFWYLESFR
jgi:hypothetical protein